MHSQGSFPDNLRLLCGYRTSISQVCRALAINRSQFNRYLAGTSTPRPALMRKICDYFGVDLHEMLLPQQAFAALIRHRGVREGAPRGDLQKHMDQVLQASSHSQLDLEGMYFEYYHSMFMPGAILRSLISFEWEGTLLGYRRLERIGPAGQVCRRHYRYRGLVLLMGDRIFLTDYEYGLKVELTQTILYPDYMTPMRTLVGVKLGVAANQKRTPCATRVYLERVPARRKLAHAP